jgi:predicted flap endonuclease-1-like 5' DNA nuclease
VKIRLLKLAYAAVALTALGWSAGAARASNYALEEIPQAIPPGEASKLRGAGIHTTADLLKKGAEPKARKALAAQLKIPDKTIDGWVQMADVLRIKGIGPDVTRLLAACGIRTVEQLKNADPAKVNDEITKVNSRQHLSQNPPSVDHLAAWIAQAQTLPIVLH